MTHKHIDWRPRFLERLAAQDAQRDYKPSRVRPIRQALCAFAGAVMVSSAAFADVKLGVLMPTSGKGAAYGSQQKIAVDMFIEKYSDLGPAGKLILVTGDTRGDNTEAISLTKRLISSDGVVAIVGPQFSAEAEVAFPIAARGQTPIITPMAAKPGILDSSRPWSFRFALTTANTYGPLVDAWLKTYSSKNIKKVVIFMDGKDAVSSNDGKNVFPQVLKEKGLQVLDTVTFQTGDIDFSAQVTRAKALSPDGIVVSALYNEGGNLVRELRKQGMDQPIVLGIGMNNPNFIELAKAGAEGAIAASDFFDTSERPGVAEWSQEFRKRLNTQPANAPGQIYDTLFLMRKCIIDTKITGKDVSADRVAVRDCWNNLKDAEAPLMGKTTINSGDAMRQPAILIVRDGNFVSLN